MIPQEKEPRKPRIGNRFQPRTSSQRLSFSHWSLTTNSNTASLGPVFTGSGKSSSNAVADGVADETISPVRAGWTD